MKFNATTRSVQGSSASRRLRRAGRVPAIVYGGTEQPINIELDHNEIYHALRKEQFHASILDMQLDGKGGNQVLLRSVQWHAYKPQVLHVDFQRVDATHELHIKVPLHFINEEMGPGVKFNGGLVNHVTTELEIHCLAKDLPEFIEIDLGNMNIGDNIHASQVTLPAGVALVKHGEDDPIVVSIVGKGGSQAAEGEAAAE